MEISIINERGYYNDDREKGGICEPTIVPSIIKLFNIKTAVDIGCGNGAYTKQFIQNGIDCIGFDGSLFTPVITNGVGLVLDFSRSVNIGKFDIVLSLEVGEHIPAKYSGIYLDNLCRAAKDLICLSWSPREDEVFGHCNCQKNDYVINEMTKRNFNFDPETTKYMRDQVIAWNHFRDSLMFFKKA